MIFMPPRHGKSELVTVRYSAWRMKQDPSLNVILGSYNQRLADRFSRKIRKVLADDAYQMQNAECKMQNEGKLEAAANGDSRGAGGTQRRPAPSIHHSSFTDQHSPRSPFPFANRPINRVSEWETAEGGGLRAVGVGSGVTGFGANLIVIDDPVKSREQANSERNREKIWDWFNDDLYTRLEPDGAIILIQTRWHEDDLAGRLLKEMANGGTKWEVVCLPALAEGTFTAETQRRGEEEEMQDGKTIESGEINASDLLSQRLSVSAVKNHLDPIKREPGAALWPERFTREHFLELKERLGSWSFSALYQQRPTPAEGGIFKCEWFKKSIVAYAPKGLRWARGYDLAISTRSTADYTASFRCAFDKDNNLYIADGFRRRIEVPEQRRFISQRIKQELDTTHGVEQAVHGLGVIQDLQRDRTLNGRHFTKVKVDGDKISRASTWSPIAEAGRIRLVRGPWIEDFIDEACSFPNATHDDQIDAVSIAVSMLQIPSSKLITWNMGDVTKPQGVKR
jgi:predicted phage terminase large subunit-like protein